MAEKREKKPLTDEQLVDLVNQEFEEALGAPGGDISRERTESLDAYLRKPLGNEVDGESQVVMSDVAEVVDGIRPSLLNIFTTADNLVNFDPVGPEDEAGAEQESDYVNHIFFKQPNAYEILRTWIQDALVQKVGIVKCWWDEYEEVTTEEYEGLSEPELMALVEDEDLEGVEQSEREGDTVDPVTQQVVRGTVYDVKFRRVAKNGCIKIANVPPEEYRISSDARSLDPCGARMVGHEREVTRSELIEMGFDEDVVADLEAEEATADTQESQARRDKSDEQRSTGKSIDPSQDKIRLREGYQKVDADGDGRAELKQIFVAGDKLLEKDDSDRQPFHVICPHPLPHKHFGQSSAEKAEDLQEVSSTLVRQILQNLYHTNRPGHAVWEQGLGENTMDDLLTTGIGVVKRFARPPSESYMPLTVPFTAGGTFPMLEYFDKVKRDRTGISSDSEALSPDALKHIQQSVLAPALEKGKMKVAEIARTLAETGIKSLFMHIHELTQKHQQKAKIVKLRNKWVPVDPREWRTRENMTVNIGLGIGTREQNLMHLNAISAKQREAIDIGWGGLVVTPQNWYRTAAEIAKNAKMDDPALHFTDPGNQMAPPQNKEQLALQQQQQQLAAREQQIEQRRQQLDAQKAQLAQQEMQFEHQREMAELKRKIEKDKDDFFIENEKLRNELLEIRQNASKPAPKAN